MLLRFFSNVIYVKNLAEKQSSYGRSLTVGILSSWTTSGVYTVTTLLTRILCDTTIAYLTNCTSFNEAHETLYKHFIQIKVFLLPTFTILKKYALCPTKFKSLKQFFDYEKWSFGRCFDRYDRPVRNLHPTQPVFISEEQRRRYSNLCL